MSKNHIALGLFLLIGALAACNKQGTDSLISEPPRVWGKMSSILQNKKLISGSDTLYFNDEIALAEFYANPDIPGVYVDAGEVKINDHVLTKDASNFYMTGATNLDIQNNLKWHVNGNGMIPNMLYNDTVSFPLYVGPMPFVLNKSTGLSLTFDTTTVKNADSVRVHMDDGNNNVVWKTFGAKEGTVMVTPGDMSALNIVNNQAAVVAICPYQGRIKAVNSRGYFYIRERRLVQSVNIN